MRRTLATLAAALLLPAAAQGAKKHRERSPSCPPAPGHILLADSAAALFELYNSTTEFFQQAACSHMNRKAFVLAECEGLECEGRGHSEFTLAGEMLAYEESQYSGSLKYGTATTEASLVKVVDLRTHRVIHSAPTSTSEPSSGKIGNGPAEGIVVKGDGSVAWIAIDGWHPYAKAPQPRVTTYQVWKLDKTGLHLLATGPRIVPNSIALAGNTVYWTNGNTPEPAPLD